MSSEDRCPSCGATITGGRAGCQALFDEMNARAYAEPDFGAVHPLVVDAYSMQHPEEYGRSAKSYAAHLMRLCAGVEHGGNPAVYAAIPRWLDGRAAIERPPDLASRGTMTLADVGRATDGKGHRDLVRAWAAEVWKAYAPQHELARAWLEAALAKPALRGRPA